MLDWIEHNALKAQLNLKDTAINKLAVEKGLKVSKIGRRKFYLIAEINKLIKSNVILN